MCHFTENLLTSCFDTTRTDGTEQKRILALDWGHGVVPIYRSPYISVLSINQGVALSVTFTNGDSGH